MLDALRAIAVLLVLGRHTAVSDTWTKIGWCGVDLFFVISGFLISGLLFQEYKRFGDIRLKTFWLRRGLKIYPAFYVYTLALVVILPITIPGSKVPLHPLLVDVAFLASYFQGLSGHTWSLAVEEHFYFLLPLFLLALMKLRAKKEDPFAPIPVVFLLIAIGSLWLRMAATPAGPRDYYSYLLPTHLRMDGLFCGVTVGYLFHFKPQLLARVPGWRLLFAAGILLMPVYFLDLENWHMYTWGLTCAFVGFACIVTWAVHVPLPRGRLLAWPITLLARIGFYSYSIYLWHWIVIGYIRQYIRYKCMTTGSPFVWNGEWETLQWPLCVACSIIVGIAMAMIVEQPALRLRDRWFPSRTRLTSDLASGTAELSPPPPPQPKSMSATA
jgi:peptidoglycan/LPS O-acetylase OafA/YrhL